MVEAWVTYMEMRSPPAGPPLPAPAPAGVVAPERLGPEDYLALFRLAGERVGWDLRLRMPRAALLQALASPGALVMVLRIAGEASGLCEFERQASGDLQLLFFGIAAACEGRGWGRFLLDRALRQAWSAAPRRIWLHTDTYDSPSAIRTYAAAGFVPFDRRWESVDAY